jgi:proline dehydrogenase
MELFNQIIVKTMPLIPKPIIRKVAMKYIAGYELKDAVQVTKDFMAKGGWTTIDVLGEFVDNKKMAIAATEESSRVIDAIYDNKLTSYLSIKPTSQGLGIDFDFAYANIKKLVAKSLSKGLWIRLDMENSPYTDKTLDLYRKLRSEGFDNVGIVLQAYMRRSIDDVKSLIDLKPSIRLCKGIYREAENIAYQGKEEVRDNYKKLFDLIVENDMYIGIATHDEPLINYAEEYISKNNLPKDKYEFQMLLGVREQKRDELLNNGHYLRIYVPYGEDWYGYSTRRLKENPNMAGHIFKAMFSNK